MGDHPAQGVTMEHGKPLQEGVRVKLPSEVTWEQLDLHRLGVNLHRLGVNNLSDSSELLA